MQDNEHEVKPEETGNTPDKPESVKKGDTAEEKAEPSEFRPEMERIQFVYGPPSMPQDAFRPDAQNIFTAYGPPNIGGLFTAPPQPVPAPSLPAGVGWLCDCGTRNLGRFCTNCGQKRSSEWTCPCGKVNRFNFCTDCGKAKPKK